MATPVVFQTRGTVVESRHAFSAAAFAADAVDSDAAPAWSTGAPVVTTWRSASKPFQLENSLRALGGDAAFDERQLAVGAASHSAEPVHLELVEGLLRGFGLDAGALLCGAHPPVHEPSAAAVLRGGGAFTALHNNCSGKHAFMLGACVARGWSLEYRPPTHPLQVANRARLEALCHGHAEICTDGCGVPTFAFPLTGLARAWATLAGAMATVAAGGQDLLGRIGWAMARHPELTSGSERLDLQLVRGAAEPLAVKIGAQGLFCIAIPGRRLGLAVKVHSGVGEALPAAVAWTLDQVAPGAFTPAEGWSLCRVRNVVGADVGEFRVAPDAQG